MWNTEERGRGRRQEAGVECRLRARARLRRLLFTAYCLLPSAFCFRLPDGHAGSAALRGLRARATRRFFPDGQSSRATRRGDGAAAAGGAAVRDRQSDYFYTGRAGATRSGRRRAGAAVGCGAGVHAGGASAATRGAGTARAARRGTRRRRRTGGAGRVPHATIDEAALRARAGALQHLLRGVPRPDGRGRRHDRAARLPAAALFLRRPLAGDARRPPRTSST